MLDKLPVKAVQWKGTNYKEIEEFMSINFPDFIVSARTQVAINEVPSYELTIKTPLYGYNDFFPRTEMQVWLGEYLVNNNGHLSVMAGYFYEDLYNDIQ